MHTDYCIKPGLLWAEWKQFFPFLKYYVCSIVSIIVRG